MASSVKYYIYISDAKVDMVYPQIKKPLLERIASELNISLKLLGAEISAGVKGNQSEETRYSKVRIVSRFVERHEPVGTVEDPLIYFKGTLPMRWGPLSHHPETVYFGGSTSRAILGLGGSTKHIIGGDPGPAIQSIFSSGLYGLLDALDETNQSSNDMEELALLAVKYAAKEMRGPAQRLEFLAKTLLSEPIKAGGSGDSDENRIVLGTPIYVALAY